MGIDSKLIKQCRHLPYTMGNERSNDVYEETEHRLRDLFHDYDYANVLGALYLVWTYEKATDYFRNDKGLTQREENKKVRAIATYSHKAYDGGTERVVAELMNIWVGMGLKVIFFSEEPGNPMDYPYPKSVKRIIIPKNDMGKRLSALQTHCISEKVDLFVNHDWTNPNSLWICMLMKMLHICYVQYCHGHFAWCFKDGKDALFQPGNFALCDLVLAISETNARFYQLYGCNTYLVENPIPHDLIDKTDGLTYSKSSRILLVGRLSYEKYPLEALEIFKIVYQSYPEALLDIVGDGDLRQDVLDYVKLNGLEHNVVFHGAKTADELDLFYRNAAFVLVTSKMEGYPMIVLEAKAYGLPIVMYELPYLSLVQDGRGILASKPGDFSAMADNMLKILRDDQYRIMLGKQARESFCVLREYDQEKVWCNIFRICTDDLKDAENPAHYSPEKVSRVDALILPGLLDRIEEGYDTLTNKLDYRIGKAILKIPRMVKRKLRSFMKR